MAERVIQRSKFQEGLREALAEEAPKVMETLGPLKSYGQAPDYKIVPIDFRQIAYLSRLSPELRVQLFGHPNLSNGLLLKVNLESLSDIIRRNERCLAMETQLAASY